MIQKKKKKIPPVYTIFEDYVRGNKLFFKVGLTTYMHAHVIYILTNFYSMKPGFSVLF